MEPLLNAVNNSWHKHVDNQKRTYSLVLTAAFKVFRDIICESTIVVASWSKYCFYALKNRVRTNPRDQRKATKCWKRMEEAQQLFENKKLVALKNFKYTPINQLLASNTRRLREQERREEPHLAQAQADAATEGTPLLASSAFDTYMDGLRTRKAERGE